MMVALITGDHGYELAAAVSDWFLYTQIREGGGPQRVDLRFRLGVADRKLLAVLKAWKLTSKRGCRARIWPILPACHCASSSAPFVDISDAGVRQHYLSLRLGRARQLLRESSLSILEVAVATSFGAASQFSRAFRDLYGFPPREMLERERGPGVSPGLQQKRCSE